MNIFVGQANFSGGGKILVPKFALVATGGGHLAALLRRVVFVSEAALKVRPTSSPLALRLGWSWVMLKAESVPGFNDSTAGSGLRFRQKLRVLQRRRRIVREGRVAISVIIRSSVNLLAPLIERFHAR